MPSGQLMQSHQCLPGEADEEPRLTLTEQYTGLPLRQPSRLEFVDSHRGAYVAQQTRLRERDRDASLSAIVRGSDQTRRDRIKDEALHAPFEIDIEIGWAASIDPLRDLLI